MTRRMIGIAVIAAGFAFPLRAQSSAAACAPAPDSTARQVMTDTHCDRFPTRSAVVCANMRSGRADIVYAAGP